MPKRLPIFYSALLLTLVNLLLRFVGTSFQVYISATLGAAGVGLLQLVMSVGSLAMIAGIAGIRTATMYLTAGELGRGNGQNISWVLSGCFVYSILCSGSVAILLYAFAPWIAENWIEDFRTLEALRLFSAFLPVTCLCGVMTGYFTAANRIGTLAAVEVAEQLISMAVTMTVLFLWGQGDSGRACQSVIFGSGVGSCVTLLCLILLHQNEHTPPGNRIPIIRPLLDTAVPLALADILKSGITTTENLIVPKRLALNPSISSPLAAFGVISGMVFPVLMFPACILFALAELLIPELARCAAADSRQRIIYLVRRGLKVAMLYGIAFSGLMFLLAEPLCISLYDNPEAARQLKWYSLLIPMLYCDAITDAMIKGLGQQKICVRYNILTSAMDVIILYLLLPDYGMEGYFLSFTVTHLVNFLLSLNRLQKISRAHIAFHVPSLAVSAGLLSVSLSSPLPSALLRCAAFALLLGVLLFLFGIVKKEDLLWLQGLILQNP